MMCRRYTFHDGSKKIESFYEPLDFDSLQRCNFCYEISPDGTSFTLKNTYGVEYSEQSYSEWRSRILPDVQVGKPESKAQAFWKITRAKLFLLGMVLSWNLLNTKTKGKIVMTNVSKITSTERVARTVYDNVTKVEGVQYNSPTSDKSVRITRSSSMSGRFTLTVANPDGSNEKAVILKRDDMLAFLADAASFVRTA